MNMERRRGLPALNYHVLQQTLRSLCSESQWVYAVFWRILPRNYPPPKWETEGGPVDRSKSNKRNWILVWEDGFCDFPACSAAAANHETATMMHPDLFFQMSHEVYNYGEGLMGKVAADNSHKWVYREPMEHEISFLSPWHGSLDPHPRTWEGQFKAGIQTIAVISVREGLIQLGSTRKLVEDPNLVILMQRKFNYLHRIPGVFVPHPSLPSPTDIKSNIADQQQQQHGSSPYWTDAAAGKDHPLNDGMFMRSNFGSFNTRQFSSQGVLGMKRPADSDIMSNPGRDFPFLSPGINFNRSGSDSPAMASNYGINGSGTSGTQKTLMNNALLPSMSSLQNLLSKLPSVTTAPDSNAPTSPGSASAAAAGQDHSPLPSGLVPQQLELQLNHLDHRNRNHNQYHHIDHELLHRQQQHHNLLEMGNLQRQLDLDNQAHHDHNRQYQQQQRRQLQLDDFHHQQQQQRQRQQQRHQQLQVEVQDEEQNSSMSELLAAVTASRGGDGGPSCLEATSQQPEAAAGGKDKLTSFLDSFDEDTLTDLGLHDDLENSQTYNSFRTQII